MKYLKNELKIKRIKNKTNIFRFALKAYKLLKEKSSKYVQSTYLHFSGIDDLKFDRRQKNISQSQNL